jgi:hypothetical protein
MKLKCNADQAISGGNTLSWLPNPDLPVWDYNSKLKITTSSCNPEEASYQCAINEIGKAECEDVNIISA